ncbi:hypothetical protein, partial [Aeromonas veronii]|uniref:hypothetical protein n=1 Tax=Aeromonas veronii TaxID=654 RepID=UPI003D1C09E1
MRKNEKLAIDGDCQLAFSLTHNVNHFFAAAISFWAANQWQRQIWFIGHRPDMQTPAGTKCQRAFCKRGSALAAKLVADRI